MSHIHTTTIAAPADRIWHALTDPDESARWYFGTGVHSSWAAGAPYAYRFPDGRTAISGTVELAEPPRRLVTSFSAQWSPGVAADPPSRVTWQVDSAAARTGGDGCTVTVTHEGVTPGSATDREVATGWPELLGRLKRFVEESHPRGAHQ